MRKKTYIVFIVALILAVGLGALAFFEASNLGVGFFEERVHQVAVQKESDLKEKADSLYNDNIWLENDITLRDRSVLFCTEEIPFIGKFDGKGYKVTLAGDFSESLFGNIGEGGLVENVEFVLKADNKSTLEEKYAALVALENRGVIRNCKITVESIDVKGAGTYGLVVAKNIGVISNVYVDAVINNAGLDPVASCVGVVAGKMQKNTSVIKNCVINVDFTGVQDEDKGEYRDSLNLIVGQSITGEISRCLVFIPQSLNYLDLSVYAQDLLPYVLEEGEAIRFNVDILKSEYQFSEELWAIEQNRLELIPESER